MENYYPLISGLIGVALTVLGSVVLGVIKNRTDTKAIVQEKEEAFTNSILQAVELFQAELKEKDSRIDKLEIKVVSLSDIVEKYRLENAQLRYEKQQLEYRVIELEYKLANQSSK